MSFIEERIDEIKATYDIANDELPENADFLTSMIFSGNLKTDQLTGNAVDFLFAGIDTTSYLLLWSLYNIATNPDIQVNLRKEINEVVGDSEVVTPEHINKLTLLRNCVKETLRYEIVCVP
jgi:cytochrome P450